MRQALDECGSRGPADGELWREPSQRELPPARGLARWFHVAAIAVFSVSYPVVVHGKWIIKKKGGKQVHRSGGPVGACEK